MIAGVIYFREKEEKEDEASNRRRTPQRRSKMKVMVAVKRVVDYAVKIRVKPDKVR